MSGETPNQILSDRRNVQYLRPPKKANSYQLKGASMTRTANHPKPKSAFARLILPLAGAICALLSAAPAGAQFQWAERIATAASLPEGEPNVGLALDTSLNCYVTGWFDGTNNFGGVTLLNQSAGGTEMFVAEYNAAGVLQWVQHAGSTSTNYGRAIGLDANGNIYVTGGYYGPADFGGLNLPATSGEQFFLAKYDSSGAVEWVRTSTGGADDNYGIGLTVDSVGNSYALAVMDHSGSSLTFGSQTVSTAEGGTTLLMLVKYDNTGTAQWAQLFDSSQETYGSKIAVDAEGNVYVRAMFESDLTIANNHLSGGAAKNMFIAKLTSSGELAWIQQPTGGNSGEGGVAVDSAGNVYVSGAFETELNFGGGISLKSTAGETAVSGDAFLAKYNSSGAIQWAQSAGGADGGFYWHVALDAQTNIYVAGLVGYDAAVAKYSPAGTLRWTYSATGAPANPVGSLAAECAVDPAGHCYLVGLYQGKTGFGASALQPQETWNLFLAEVGQSTNSSGSPITVIVSPPGTGTVSPISNGQSLQVGEKYTMTAKPATGCKFIGWTGSTHSSATTLTFVMEPGLSFTADFKDTQRPTCAVLYPKAKQSVTSSTITATGKASDNVGVTAVSYQFNTNAWAPAIGATSWSTPSLTLTPGTNLIRAYSTDAAGNASLTNSITFTYLVSYAGVYVGQTNDDPSGYPGGFALFVDANQRALLIGGDPYNNDDGNAVFGSCSVSASGNGHSDISGDAVSFTIYPNGSVNLTMDADASSEDYPWHWEITGNLVSSDPFQAVAGAYSGSASGQTVQAILSPDGWFYLSPPNHGGGGRCQFTAYGQPVTQDESLGHTALSLTLYSNATISIAGTNSKGTSAMTMKRVDALPLPPH
jgi:hypothetical protein